MTTLADLITLLERAYPPELAQSWDAIGLVCGDPDQPVAKVHVCVDPVSSTVDEAIDAGADLMSRTTRCCCAACTVSRRTHPRAASCTG